MTKENKKSIIEAILFLNGEPYPLKDLAKFLNISLEETKNLLEELANYYEKRRSGLTFIVSDKKVQMTTSAQVSLAVQKFLNKNFSDNLSPVLLETLAIIAYKGPLSRAKIDEIRGVNSSYPLRVLLLRGLIEKKPHPTIPNAYIYEASFDFLRFLGINSLKELPNYEKIRGTI